MVTRAIELKIVESKTIHCCTDTYFVIHSINKCWLISHSTHFWSVRFSLLSFISSLFSLRSHSLAPSTLPLFHTSLVLLLLLLCTLEFSKFTFACLFPLLSPSALSLSPSVFVYQQVLIADPAALLSVHHLHFSCERLRTAGRENSDVFNLNLMEVFLRQLFTAIVYLLHCLSGQLFEPWRDGRLTGQTHKPCLNCK